MEKKLLLFLLFAIFSFQIFAQVPQKQRSLIVKISATWCPPCGGWAWTTFEELVTDNTEDAVLITAHYSGDLFNNTADEIAENVNANFQPAFFLDDVHQNINSGNASSKRTEIQNAVTTNAAEMPVANMAINVTFDPATRETQVATTTKFFQDATGEYYIASYFIENEVENSQAGQSANPAIHEKIMRGGTTAETFGELIVNGAISADSEFEHTNTVTLDDTWNEEHMEFVSIIWKKENDKYQFVNTNITTEFTTVMPVSADEVNSLVSAMSIQPTITNSIATISIDLENELQNTMLEVFDFSGKKVDEIFQGKMAVGNNTFTIAKSIGMTAGMYLVVLQTEEGPVTRKVIFE